MGFGDIKNFRNRLEEFFELVKQKDSRSLWVKIANRVNVAKNYIEPRDVTSFLMGFALTLTAVAGLMHSNVVEDPFNQRETSGEYLPPQEVGQKTVDMLNRRILHSTPNNVTGELAGVEEADRETLPQFYVVTVKVINPTARQKTKVYVKKDGSLLFLNHPRYFNREKYRDQQHQ